MALTRSGTTLTKYWLDIQDETQKERFEQRLCDPRRRWKLSPMDLEARSRGVDYAKARGAKLVHTDSAHAPWYIVDANIERHARLNVSSHLLSQIPYEDLPSEPLESPPRQEAGDFAHPDCSKTKLSFVPAVYA